MADLLGNDMGNLAEASLLRRQGADVGMARRSRALLDRLRSGNRGTDPAATRQALRQASREFEAILMNQLVSAMRKTVGEGGLLEKSEGEKIFEGMLDEEWARRLAGRSGPNGLSEMIYQQLSRRLGLEPEDPSTAAPSGVSPDAVPGHPLLSQSAVLPPAVLER